MVLSKGRAVIGGGGGWSQGSRQGLGSVPRRPRGGGGTVFSEGSACVSGLGENQPFCSLGPACLTARAPPGVGPGRQVAAEGASVCGVPAIRLCLQPLLASVQPALSFLIASLKTHGAFYIRDYLVLTKLHHLVDN